MSALEGLDDIAAYLHVEVIAGEPSHVAWRRSGASLPVEILWDAARGVACVRARLDVDAARYDARALAVAIAAINLKLEVFGVEYDDEPVFVSHVFFDADGKVSARALERLLLAVDECDARTRAVLAGLTPRGGA